MVIQCMIFRMHDQLEHPISSDRANILAQLRIETGAQTDEDIEGRADLISNGLRQQMLDNARQTGAWAFPVSSDSIIDHDPETGSTIIPQQKESPVYVEQLAPYGDVTDSRFTADFPDNDLWLK